MSSGTGEEANEESIRDALLRPGAKGPPTPKKEEHPKANALATLGHRMVPKVPERVERIRRPNTEAIKAKVKVTTRSMDLPHRARQLSGSTQA